MKTSIFAIACATLIATTPAIGQRPLKSGDKVMLRDTSEKGGWLSWYKGNWVVLDDARIPGKKGQWEVQGFESTDDEWELQIKNLHSVSFLDGDQDNSVVLDDTDHTKWSIDPTPNGTVTVYESVESAKAAAKEPGAIFHLLYNADWERKYVLSDKGNDVRDVVLRSVDPGIFQSGGLLSPATKGTEIRFQFVRVRE